MHMPARTLDQPFPDDLSFMGGVIVHHEVYVEIGRDAGFDPIKKTSELGRTVTRVALTDDTSGRHVEGGKQARGSVARGLAWAHGQHGLAAIQRLNLTHMGIWG
jgi:hypothetical protein